MSTGPYFLKIHDRTRTKRNVKIKSYLGEKTANIGESLSPLFRSDTTHESNIRVAKEIPHIYPPEISFLIMV